MYLLRRFLRARQHNIPKAKAMFIAFLKWREENHVDTILQDFHFTERATFIRHFPQGYHKTDKLVCLGVVSVRVWLFFQLGFLGWVGLVFQ
jgi:hypothetical protein